MIASLVDYTEAFQDPKSGVQMQERLVVNQTQKVFTGWPHYNSSTYHFVMNSWNRINFIGSDAIQWLVDNVLGLSSVEAAQVPLILILI